MGNCYQTSESTTNEIFMRSQKRRYSVAIESYRVWQSFPNDSPVLCLTHFKLDDQDLIAAGFKNSEIKIWNAYSKDEDKLQLTLQSHFSAINAITSLKLNSSFVRVPKTYLISGD